MGRGEEKNKMTIYDFLWERRKELLKGEGLLYHYTSLGTFEKLLEDDGDFYCTNALMLNDDSELVSGLDIIQKHLKEKFGWTEDRMRWFAVGYRKLIAEGAIVLPWIMSFSRAKDSLTQWGMYTDRQKGGVSIGLRRDSLWDAIDRLPGRYSKVAIDSDSNGSSKSAFILRLLPCLYAETDQELINELFEFRGTQSQDVFKRIGRVAHSEDIDPRDFQVALMTILEVAVLVKHEAFRNEQEERLVLLPKTNVLQDCKILGGKPRWQTYIAETRKEGEGKASLKFLRGMFQEVMISPHGDRQSLWLTTRFLLEKYGMNFCELKCSELPYNGR